MDQNTNNQKLEKTSQDILSAVRKQSDEAASPEPLFRGPGAVIEGDVRFGPDVSVWHNAVIRTESDPITIGEGSNIQDGCILHTDPGYPILIGKNVTIGHGAIVHGAVIEDDCLVGMGAVILNGAHIKKGSLVGAGAVVGEGKIINPGMLALGVPAKEIRKLTPEEQEHSIENAKHYVNQARHRIDHQF